MGAKSTSFKKNLSRGKTTRILQQCQKTNLTLVASIGCAGVYDNLVNLAEAPKILGFFEDLGIRKSGGEAHHKDEISLHHSDIG